VEDKTAIEIENKTKSEEMLRTYDRETSFISSQTHIILSYGDGAKMKIGTQLNI
jgi:hypothetical protein